ncbi:glycosyltransferase family 2 protein [Streptantibioticus silvisoli]|uniref:Glycosyltransferase family A protein n=1 Tax=Streptantibioticus silvisoli TaxID=2705255 RepID=A0ABT6VW58_9ACTN|nr:glycosyltransferase family A protein [Streptantibioticus silvisoli]MDI5962723.1 glycosyltransferase family A protein [Streptantibioticus silvisoli]
MKTQGRHVTVVVIGYNDAVHITEAVASALAQGPAVAEVVAVDDCSTDGTGDVLDRLAAAEPRLRAVRRTTNSGGCGTPRNDGIAAAGSPYLMFLDSDDVLPPGAVDALLAAAVDHDADVTAGLCVRRELPDGRETPWRPELHEAAAVIARPADDPRLAEDTLCVNKLYRTGFLREHAIAFPDGKFVYEDFVFTARVQAAAPRVALITDTVYVWHVRRSAKQLSISLDRSGVENWRARVEAHRQVVAIHTEVGNKALVRAARAGFLDRSVRMYVRELGARGPEYRREWWRLTREYLAGFDAADLAATTAPARVIAGVVLAADQPRDLPRLAALAARPPRLLPPYAAEPVWSQDLPQVALEDLVTAPVDRLPLTVEAALETGATRARLTLRVHDLYGRLAAARPLTADVEIRDRTDGSVLQRRTAALTAAGGGWDARVSLDLPALLAGPLATRDVAVVVRCADGESVETVPHAVRKGLRRTVVPTLRGGALLAQPYATADGALALRLAPALRGALSVVRRRLGR